MATVRIPLRSRKYPGHFAVVEEEDYPHVRDYTWNIAKGPHTFYAITYGGTNRAGSFMHRMILGTPDGIDTDHADGDGLNNTRENLREATRTQNNANRRRLVKNTTGFRGVFRSGAQWRAQIQHDGKAHHLGCYETPEDAARAYDIGAIRIHGAFANLNFDRAEYSDEDIATHHAPHPNRHGYRGVKWSASRKRWEAAIQVDGKRRYLGRFRTAEDAALAYDREARRLHGDRARLNFAN